MISFAFTAHNYFIIEQAIDGLYINIKREMRLSPFVGMKQPAPEGAIIGHDCVLIVKYNGQIASGYKWTLYRSNTIVQNGITNHNGMSFGLNVELSEGCKCFPQDFKPYSKAASIEHNINNRRCDAKLVEYSICFNLSSCIDS